MVLGAADSSPEWGWIALFFGGTLILPPFLLTLLVKRQDERDARTAAFRTDAVGGASLDDVAEVSLSPVSRWSFSTYLKSVREALVPDERVLAVDRTSDELIVVTDRRVLVIFSRNFRYDLPLDGLETESKGRLIAVRLRLRSGDQEVRLAKNLSRFRT